MKVIKELSMIMSIFTVLVLSVFGIVSIAEIWLPEKTKAYKEGFEAGKLYVRNAMFKQNDSIISCGKMGYFPDTISVKEELNNRGSYEIKGRSNQRTNSKFIIIKYQTNQR